MQTRKYPRTLQEAFGPHTSREVLDKTDYDPADLIVMAGCLAVVLVAVVFVIVGWIV
jgi:hypothetical protein